MARRRPTSRAEVGSAAWKSADGPRKLVPGKRLGLRRYLSLEYSPAYTISMNRGSGRGSPAAPLRLLLARARRNHSTASCLFGSIHLKERLLVGNYSARKRRGLKTEHRRPKCLTCPRRSLPPFPRQEEIQSPQVVPHQGASRCGLAQAVRTYWVRDE